MQPYEGVDAYKIYNLLLPHEESYAFAEDVLMIQENAVAQDISGACLRQADANRFKGAIADYNRAREKKWLFQRHFQIAKSYRIVGAEPVHCSRSVSGSRLWSWKSNPSRACRIR